MSDFMSTPLAVIERPVHALHERTKDQKMTSLDEVQKLQTAYGSDWTIRITNSVARATRRRNLSDEEMSAGMAMTLFDGDGSSLAEQLAEQQCIEDDLIETALQP